jgi:hypothetical protein
VLGALLRDITRRPAVRLLGVAVVATILVLPGLSTPGATKWEQGPLAAEGAIVTALSMAHVTAAILGAWLGTGQGSLAVTVQATPVRRANLVLADVSAASLVAVGLVAVALATLPAALALHDVTWLRGEHAHWSAVQSLGSIPYYAALGHLLGSLLPLEGALLVATTCPLVAQFAEPWLADRPALRWIPAVLPSPLGVAPPRVLVDLQGEPTTVLLPVLPYLAGTALATAAVILIRTRRTEVRVGLS